MPASGPWPSKATTSLPVRNLSSPTMATQVRERRGDVQRWLGFPWLPGLLSLLGGGWGRGRCDEAPRKESREEPLRDPWATLCRRCCRPWAQVVLLRKYLLEAAHLLGWDGERLEPLDLSMIWYESEGVTQFTGGLAQESDQSEFESWLDYI